MDMQGIKLAADRCIQEEPVYCKSACPLKLDIRDIIEKMQNDNFAGAFQIYRRQSVFPQIVSRLCTEPCRAACIRGQIDESIHIRELEASLCRFGDKGGDRKYLIPRKKNVLGIHIIGGGLCGISCALLLAEKGYQINLYEKGGCLGGKLRTQSPDVLSGNLLNDTFQRVRDNANVSVFFNAEIQSLDSFGEDLIVVSTGNGGNHFGLFADGEKKYDPVSLQSVQDNVFVGGGLILGQAYNQAEDIACAKKAVISIERYLKKSSLLEGRDREGEENTRLVTSLQDIPAQSAVQPSERGYLREQAKEEAARCILCECKICVMACRFLEYYKEYPRKYLIETYQSLNVIEKLSENISKRQMNSCNLCGLCGVLCPTGLDMSEVYLAARRILHKKGEMPPAFYDFFIEDMKFSTEEASALLLPPEGKKSLYMFFPGCQLGASMPNTLERTYSYLKKIFNGQIALKLHCCGAPAYWSGREDLHESVLQEIRSDWEFIGKPTMILACPTCRKLFQEHLPEIPSRSLWEILAETGLLQELEFLAEACGTEHTAALFDPCASRDDPAGQDAVRQILKVCGIGIEELPLQGKSAQCCGYGGLMKYTNPDLAKVIATDRNRLSVLEYITYCVNCRDTFLAGGKPARHILECLFGRENREKKLSSLSEKRDNRRELKRRLMGGYEILTADKEQKSRPIVYISEELIEKMDQLLILRENVEQAIQFCEENNRRLRIRGQEGFTGHMKQGYTTFWVSYRPVKCGYELRNVYCHRMALESEAEGGGSSHGRDHM